ncbi:MAG TPA: MarR family transcriptional regulator [Xanthobacteraceae bacterium]|nr:MarR family transcriptional regulator [Xanthobacteraceae bacterium]
MQPDSRRREFAFLLNDVARLLRTCADQKARQFGMTRAQWAVLARLQRSQGLKQAELADMLDLQPITLTRLLDRLSANELIERRPDPDDRRANRLFLTPAAGPLMERLNALGDDLMGSVLDDIDDDAVDATVQMLGRAKENLRRAIQKNTDMTLSEAHG